MNANVVILSAVEAPESDQASFDATITLLNPPLMELAARQPVDDGAALRITTEEAIWLGDAERSVASGDNYAIRVRLRHVLRDFETLARLAERFGGTARKTAPKQSRSEYSLKEQTVRI